MIGTSSARRHAAFALAVLGVALASAPAHAQTEGTTTPVPHHQTISANPFGLMFEWYNGEYERKVGERSTVGVSASGFALDDGDADYVNVAAFYRFYPQRAALSGFYIGGRGGVHHVESGGDAGEYFGLGFELGYTWLLGADRHFAVSIGAGATRLFGGDVEGVPLTIPTLRLLNVGVAF
jgi:hypothetical protein